MMVQEWALTAEDIVWRRSKRGLVLTANEIAVLDQFMKTETGYDEKAA
jgi:glycerol-3-phosphate dehydrogenase